MSQTQNPKTLVSGESLLGAADPAAAAELHGPSSRPGSAGGLSVGQLVSGRFKIDALAASGGMGDVFRATDLLEGGLAAVKVMRSDVGSLERFNREAECLARLRHPRVPKYLQHGALAGGQPFLAMEWLEGEPLAAVQRRRRFNLSEVLLTVRGIAEGIAAAHALGIVHRDLSPSNIFLVSGEAAQVRLLDLGVAAHESGAAVGPITREGTQLGTPGYMSPEQVEGLPEISPAADVFSLGCVLFELLTGERPFYAPTLQGTFARLLTSEPAHPREFSSFIPRELDRLTLRLLEKRPEDRPPNGSAVLALLDSLPEFEDTPLDGDDTTPAEVSDQQVSSIVLLRDSNGELLEKAQQIAQNFSLSATRDAEGTVVIATRGAGTATDHATQAARVAVALLRATRTPISVSTGLVRQGGASPSGRALDSALVALLMRTEQSDGERRALVLLDENTASLLDARFDVRQAETGFILRGLRQTYEPTRTVLGRKTKCVGRRRELSMLDATLSECSEDRAAGAILISGPPGIGKTRLAFELTRRARRSREAVEILRGNADSMTAGAPYSSLIQLLERTSNIVESDTAEARRAKLGARIARTMGGDAGASVSASLGELLGAASPSSLGRASVSRALGTARRDPVVHGDQVQHAFEDWLRAECEAHPVLIILDDFHWGDLATVQLLDSALRNLSDQPLLVVALARPELHETFPTLWVKRGVTELRLSGLSRRAAEELVREVIGDAVSQTVLERVLDRAQGNPFWIEELLRAESAGEGEDVPDRILLLAQSRLAGLAPDARRVLRSCSVFGRRFWMGAARFLAGGDTLTRPVDAIRQELIEAEILLKREESRFDDEEELEFSSNLLRDAAYSMLSDDEREICHTLAAEWLERVGGSEALPIAMHYTLGGEADRARAFYLRAARQALSGNDLDSAISSAEEGLASGAQGAEGVELRLVHAEASRWRGDNLTGLRSAQAAYHRAEVGTPSWYRAAAEIAVGAGKCGKPDDCLAVARELLDSVASDATAVERPIALGRVATQLVFIGKLSLSRALLELHERGEERLRPDPLVAGFLNEARAIIAGASDDPAGRLDFAEAAASDFEDAGDLRNACAQRLSLGYAQVEFGLLDEAKRSLEMGLAIAERLNLANLIPTAQLQLGRVHCRLNDSKHGMMLLQDAAASFDRQKNLRLAGTARIYIAEAHLSLGALDFAEDAARRAAAILETMEPLRRGAQGLLSLILLEAGDTEGALQVAETANGGLNEQARIPVSQTTVRLALAEALLSVGQKAEGNEVLQLESERLLEISRRMPPEQGAIYLRGTPERARVMQLATIGPSSKGERFSTVLRASSGKLRTEEDGEMLTAVLADLSLLKAQADVSLRHLLVARAQDRLSGAFADLVDGQNAFWLTFSRWAARGTADFIKTHELAAQMSRRLALQERVLPGVAGPLVSVLEATGIGDLLRGSAQETAHAYAEDLAQSLESVRSELAPAYAQFVDLLSTDPTERRLAKFMDRLRVDVPGAVKTDKLTESSSSPDPKGTTLAWVEVPSSTVKTTQALERVFRAWHSAGFAENADDRALLILEGNCHAALLEFELVEAKRSASNHEKLKQAFHKNLKRLTPPLLRPIVSFFARVLAGGFVGTIAAHLEQALPHARLSLLGPPKWHSLASDAEGQAQNSPSFVDSKRSAELQQMFPAPITGLYHLLAAHQQDPALLASPFTRTELKALGAGKRPDSRRYRRLTPSL